MFTCVKNLKIIFFLGVSFLLSVALFSCIFQKPRKAVVIYVCIDQVYAEPVLKAFEQKTGIKVLPVYDVEATKTSGMINRLIAEKPRPQADVFWNNEFAQTFLLKERGVLAPYFSAVGRDISTRQKDEQGFWTAFGGRARVIIVNRQLVAEKDYPKSIYDLLDPKWPAERIAISSPVFGTSATQVAAMYALFGPEKARKFFKDLKERNVRILDGNSVVKDLVAGGQLLWGLVDSDDAFTAIHEGKNIEMIFPDQETIGTLIIPGTVSLVAGAPHPEEARQLIDYLLQPETEKELISAGLWLEDLAKVKNMDVKFSEVMQQAQTSRDDLKNIFVR